MLNLFCKLAFLFLLLYTYISFYYVIKVNIYNEMSHYDEELTRSNITNEVAFKSPFYFDAPHLSKDICMNDCTVLKQTKYYTLYNDVENYANECFLPYIKCDITHNLYDIKASHKSVLFKHNKMLRNFYSSLKGKIDVYLVHPKYKSNLELWDDNKPKCKHNLKIVKYIKESKHVLKHTLHSGNFVYVPNFWFIYAESESKNSVLDAIHIETPLNKLYNQYVQ